jgi:5-oxopent-3-ene-1,2,5-tricarboxylate decarboxylase / 2-hydroxyhepta-2,4-diene-1,7-dioate isomerase
MQQPGKTGETARSVYTGHDPLPLARSYTTSAAIRHEIRRTGCMVSVVESVRPSKIIAVHLNYASRASQRGRTPDVPSYFLKPPSSLAVDGDPVARPRGCELLCFEGEIALVIGQRARHVRPEDGLSYVSGLAAANDFGVYDLRWADRGSNLMAKGQDGFTPVSSPPTPIADVELDALTLRTRVNGEIAQEATTAELIFGFGHLVADLSRLMTLEPGDLILCGTPAGSRPVAPGDVVEVEVEGVGLVANPIVEGDRDLEPIGAMPRVTPAARAAAHGTDVESPLSAEAEAALGRVAVATLTSQLLRRGIRNTFIKGLRPTRPDLRMVGRAFTLRYVPLREDVVAADKAELNAQKRAIETIGPGQVLVIEARGELGAGTIGDILALRALRRGATGIVTDGGLRDTPTVAGLDIPTYYATSHAAVLGIAHYPLDVGVPVACGGVLVMPGDVIVGDAEGAVVVPIALAEEVARDALDQEEREEFAAERVDAGESIRGLFPLAESRRAEFEAWRAQRRAQHADQEVHTP